jgi:hypothetical protein
MADLEQHAEITQIGFDSKVARPLAAQEAKQVGMRSVMCSNLDDGPLTRLLENWNYMPKNIIYG